MSVYVLARIRACMCAYVCLSACLLGCVDLCYVSIFTCLDIVFFGFMNRNSRLCLVLGLLLGAKCLLLYCVVFLCLKDQCT